MTTPTLETERLTLRPITLSDAPSIQKYFANWNIIRHMGATVPWPYPDDGALSFFRDDALPRSKRGEAHFWGITEKGGDGHVIGVIEFRLQANENGHRGFWLGEPYWGRGYMSEAVFAVNDFVFDVLGYDEFIEDNVAENIASRVLKEKSGAILIEEAEKPISDGTIKMYQRWKITKTGWASVKN